MYIYLRSTFKKMMYFCKIYYGEFVNTISTFIHMPNHLLLLHSTLFVLDNSAKRLMSFKYRKQTETKIKASGPITSWQIGGETVETVTDFILGGSKITAGGD